ncbi:DUF805 domain-containing protein [Zobellia galactanivorans]|uniref:DUF805 family protein n=1 Tax=Zobellia galactanivorans (strain DSM 12802 / CCUG 47099 / CIP 106680 / NCIMB 13871 / Dsij) TaxID=63186 RepID=G0L1Q6_ZOBGA|nr:MULTISPECIES: DUF805 domain-containing protein [Zobellia]MBU3024353.1 DUF805 domain-containing protein [Zobellia galactanivorans]MDO6807460.1 DUF805 domain-containing protein [Zobellia galactanivorans]OWW24170.1 DUF805 domain-containing protein [Zobellia sp. OII3]CAZ97842.1 DUF805 family protein [Zobellia galactanivorans]
MNWYLKVLQNYAGFGGRARRKEYWMFFLFNTLISYGLLILAGLLEIPALGFLYMIYAFGVLIPSIAVAIRRMHDVGKSGWFILVPIYNLILACTDSEKGDNQYGPNPKAEEVSDLQKV